MWTIEVVLNVLGTERTDSFQFQNRTEAVTMAQKIAVQGYVLDLPDGALLFVIPAYIQKLKVYPNAPKTDD